MNLLKNTLLESVSSDGQQEVMRVLRVDVTGDLIYLIRIDQTDALPEFRQLSEVEADLTGNKFRMLTADPYAFLHNKPEESIPKKCRQKRDKAWNLIESIISAPNAGALDPTKRGRLIQATIKKTGAPKKMFIAICAVTGSRA